MNNKLTKHDLIRLHLKTFLSDVSFTNAQIVNIGTMYNIPKDSASSLAKDLRAQGFLKRIGHKYRVSDWVTKLSAQVSLSDKF